MTAMIPANVDAERAILGAVLLNRDALIPLATFLLPEMFYVEQHGWVYSAMLHCYHQRTPPDIRTVGEVLRQRGQLDALGGIGGLATMVEAGVVSSHAAHYGRIVEQAALRRRIIQAGGAITALGYDEATDPETTIAQAHETLGRATFRQTGDGLIPLGEVMGDCYDALNAEHAPGLASGLPDYDGLTGGHHADDFVVIAARPSVGKTALALSLALPVVQAGQRVVMFSLEMSRQQLGQRLTSIISGVPMANLRDRRFRSGELDAAVSAFGQLGDLPMMIDDTPGISMPQLRARAVQDAARHGPPALVLIDYIQLVRVPGIRRGDDFAEVSEISRQCKELAKVLHTTVIGLSQLSRDVEKRGGAHVPVLSDLRGSGQIEQDADVVAFPHRPALYDENEPGLVAYLYVAKNRNGPTGVVPLRWNAATMHFQPLAYREAYQ